MQRQFMQTPPLRGNGYRQEPTPPSPESPSADARRGVPPAPPQPNTFLAPTPSSRPPGTGLLSNWKANAALKLLTEQETLEHEAVHTPVTGPARHPGHAMPNFYAPSYQLGTTPPQLGTPPSSVMFMPPPIQTVRPQPPIQQPTTVGPYPQPLQPLVPMPGTTAAPAQPVWYQYGPRPAIPPSMLPAQRFQPGVRPGSVPRKKKKPASTGLRIVLAVVALLLLVGGSIGGYYYFTLSTPLTSILGQQVPRLKGDVDPASQGRGSGGSVLTGGRINILLLGSDTDEKFTNADGTHTYLAQTDIVVTVDPSTRDVTMFSIPRDFWVNVPGHGMHKLDEAYALGGVALSRLTIYQDFGIQINYYAWVGLDGFVKVIDTAGGIDIDVIHPITDDQYPDDVGNNTTDVYRYKRLYLAPGPQHLGGIEALEYVRSRHADLVGDFGRSARQQQVLKQLKNKLNNSAILGELPALANDLNGYVRTDMQLTDVFNLLRYARGIDTSKIKQITLGPPYSNSGTTPSGKSVVFPHCNLIVPVITQVFGSAADAKCNIIDPNAPTSTPTPTSTPASAPTPMPTSQGFQASPGISTMTQVSSGNTLQTAAQMANVSSTSLYQGDSDLFGIHSLLDLLFLVVFESPDALQL